MVLEAIKYDHDKVSLQILDQLQLPHKIAYREIRQPEDAYEAIKLMQVRGAPAIAIVAALSVSVKYNAKLQSTAIFASDTAEIIANEIKRDLDYLVTSRPTAVNLSGAVSKLKHRLDICLSSKITPERIIQDYVANAAQMLKDDIRDNEAIGRHGSDWIKGKSIPPISVITHCNTGSLATAGYGTALGVIRSLHANGNLLQAFFTETRPYNQGSRLTAFELLHDNIPAVLITDSMASALLSLKSISERISAIIVGADRVAANGDTANKIGTYSLAIAARHHEVKFLVAAPSTTIDLNTSNGSGIIIEERLGEEMTTIRGPIVKSDKTLDLERPQTVSIAAQGISVWNPAFDVTPCALIDGIITEFGVVEKDSSGGFDLRGFLDEKKG